MQWFATAKDAKEYFVGQVLAQAVMESAPLREEEEQMLWRSAGAETHDLAVEGRTGHGDFERRMTGMLSRALERASQMDADAEEM